MDPSYNSSDDEPMAPPNPWAHLGAASLASMLAIEDPMQERIAGKRAFKETTLVTDTPQGAQRMHMWLNRFHLFRKQILGIGPKETPTGEQIERFSNTIVKHMQPQAGGVPSLGSLKNGIVDLKRAFLFYFPTFQLSNHEECRIAENLLRLVQEGFLTRKVKRESHWVGSRMIRTMINSLLQDAFDYGTMNWDITLYRVMSLVVYSATAARAGDLSTDTANANAGILTYLMYQDIAMRFIPGGSELKDLFCQITMRGQKGSKTNEHANRTVVCKALDDTNNNVLCPINMILITALRQGNVFGTNIDEVLRLARKRRDKTSLWHHPERPVFCQMTNASLLAVDKPAYKNQFNRIVGRAGQVAGVLAKIRSHDLRRGGAREAALLPQINGIATPGVASVLGHSHMSLQTGVTQHYVGGMTHDVWTDRVNLGPQHPLAMEPMIDASAGRTSNRKRTIGARQIREYCEANGFDPDDTNQRDRVRKRLKKAEHEQLIKQHLNASVEDTEEGFPHALSLVERPSPVEANPADVLEAGSELATRGAGPTGSRSMMTMSRQDDPEVDEFPIDEDLLEAGMELSAGLVNNPNKSPNTLPMSNIEAKDPDVDEYPVDEDLLEAGIELSKDIPIDPRLLEENTDVADPADENISINLADLVAGNTSTELADAMEAAAWDITQATEEDKALAFDGMEPIAFIRKLSTINTFAHSQRVGDPAAFMESLKGNGKSPPVRFIHACRNKRFGCEYTHQSSTSMAGHEPKCILTSDEAFEEKKRKDEARVHPCTFDDCEAVYKTERSLKDHVKKMHKFTPRRCQSKGCADDTIWQDHKALEKHKRTVHWDSEDTFTAIKCKVPSCSSDKVYTTRRQYQKHLTGHGLHTEESKFPYYDVADQKPIHRGKYEPKKCTYAGCTSDHIYPDRPSYQQHLLKTHGLTLEERHKYEEGVR
ncbi:uncharacterized protein KY384_001501 [Bacidia gigantensis]|uniref:uncharacterized protein n=1 Tax=Bacidia gigantensis TaxID=2732470 RepID=UPI001D058FCE|nr:uncharacterized protein KY384_001501 [Bacidia gigantensis]KAG8533760.1 hypothetical protein KY384_001501 [Bacidia gigantensis]